MVKVFIMCVGLAPLLALVMFTAWYILQGRLT